MSEIIIQHDGLIDIATGRHRGEINWKNKEWLWSSFLEKVKETHRTAESFTEYMAAKKTRQDEIKDVGGFVGGFLNGGRRKSNSVVHRQLITLDIDFAYNDFWSDFTLVYGNSAVLHSTHKHCESSPRYRLIIPLSREVTADEYVAIVNVSSNCIGYNFICMNELSLKYSFILLSCDRIYNSEIVNVFTSIVPSVRGTLQLIFTALFDIIFFIYKI